MNPWPVEADVPEVHLPRPGHADLAGVWKFGFTDVRNVLERASARETAARVAAGALAKAFLRAVGVEIVSHVTQIASVRAPERDDLTLADFADVDASPVRCLDAETTQGDGRGDQRAAEAQRVARRDLRAARVRARARPRLARLVGGAAGRPHRHGAALDPGVQGRRARRRLRPRRPPGLRGPRRDLLRRRPRLLPRDQPLGRARGRHDDRRAAGRALRDEAAADADQAAALGRHRDARAGPGAARADRLRRRAGGGRGGGGDARDRARRRLPRRSSAATTSTTCARRSPPTKSGSGGSAGGRRRARPRLHRLHGGREDDGGARRGGGARRARGGLRPRCSRSASASRSRTTSPRTARRRSARWRRRSCASCSTRRPGR